MNKILVISVLTVILLSMSFTLISAQSKYDIPAWVKGVAGFWSEGKITDDDFGDGLSFLIDNNIITVPKIKQLQDENTRLQSENIKLRNDIVKLKTENSQPKQNQIQSTSELNSGYPSIDKRYSGTDAKEKIKELFNFHNSMVESQRLLQISKPVLDSEFVFAMIYDGKWNAIYMKGDTGESDEGVGVTLIPFDCSHNMNYMQLFTIQKIDEYGLASGIIFKNGVAIAYDSSDKPYAMFAIATFCDTGFDVNTTYLKTLS